MAISCLFRIRADPLRFSGVPTRKAPAQLIRPGLMYTDGGSIPKIAQVFKGLSPWGYAPAYMIYDWVFTARHCIVDGETNARFDQVHDVTFKDFARDFRGGHSRADRGRAGTAQRSCGQRHHHRSR